LALLPGRNKTSARGVSHAQSFTFSLFCFILFCLHRFIKNTKKLVSFIVAFYLLAFSFARMGTPENTKLCDFTSTKNNDFICTPIAPLMSTHTSVPVDSVGSPSAEVCRAAASFP
jgi:hypothetical protein